MIAEQPELHLVLPGLPPSVAIARRAVRAYVRGVGVEASTAADVALAVSEAATNAVVHAYRDRDPPGDITIDARVGNGELVVGIADEGEGIRPRPDSPGLGVGMSLIAALSRSVTLAAKDGCQRVEMHFAAPTASVGA